MAWRVAKSLETLLAQVNALAPGRSKKSDGGIGDAKHASKASDHNPWVKDGKTGVVTARDYTHDPKGGFDAYRFAERLRSSQDPRIKYVISNKRIFSGAGQSQPAWLWRKYHGVNPHDKHTHVSVKATKAHYDSTLTWNLDAPTVVRPVATPPPAAPARPVLKQGSKGQEVRNLQSLLKVAIDGDFGPKTKSAVAAFQKATGLKADGVVGPLTWEKLSVSSPLPAEQTVNEEAKPKSVPVEAIETFMALGWPKFASVALVASMVWESGGNQGYPAKPYTIVWGAQGDRDATGVYHAFGGAQWLGPRFEALKEFAKGMGKPWTDSRTQLLFVDRELNTTERRAATALRAATSLEEAMAAALTFWRPSVPHADRRMVIARKLLEQLG